MDQSPAARIAPPAAAAAAAGRPHAVVVGSGFGGLAAALRLACRGYRVTVLEKLDGPGGRAYVHRRAGFTFDAGPTIITAPHFLDALWRLCGRRLADDVQLQPVAPFYRFHFADGAQFDYHRDPAAMEAEIRRLAPADLDGWRRFAVHADRCYQLLVEQMGAVPFTRLADLLRAAPALMRLQGWRSVHALAARHVRDPRLQQMLSFHSLLIGGNPFVVTAGYSLISALERRHGVHWPVGGTGVLVDGLVRMLQGQGGELRLNAEVARIRVEDRGGRPRASGVVLASGEQIAADIVVCNGDAAWTYRYLIDARHRRHWTDRRIDRGRYSMSLFVWYFGLDRRYDDLPHHTLIMGPRYRELLDDIFERKQLADDFSVYLHRPSATDPSMAPPGCDTFYLLAPVPHLDSGTDWPTVAPAYREKIAAALERSLLPDFPRHIVTEFVTTPADFRDRLLSYKGAAFGLEPRMTQSAWFRPHAASEDVDRLYFVGASTHPGAGVPGVLLSAEAAQQVIPDPQRLRR